MDQERSGEPGRAGEQPDPAAWPAREDGSPAGGLRAEWAVPGVERESALVEGLELLGRGLASLREVGVSGWCLGDVAVRDGVRDLDAVRQQVEHVWLGLVHELDRRPGAVPGSRAGGVARRFLTGGLNRSPGQARKDVEAARALFRADPDQPEPDPDRPDGDADRRDPDADLDQPGGPDGDTAGAGGVQDLAGDDGVSGEEGPVAGSAGPGLTDPRARLARMGAACEAGEVSREHLDIAVECLRNIPRHLARAVDAETGLCGTQRVDAFLSDQARQFDPRHLRHLGKQLLAVLDPDGQNSGFDPEAYLRRTLSLRDAGDGMTLIRGQVDAAAAVWLKAALDHFSSPERVLQPEPTSGEQGELPVEPGDERTPGQRSADALIAIARRALDSIHTQVRREPAHVLILTNPEQLADAHTRTPPGDPDPLPGTPPTGSPPADAPPTRNKPPTQTPPPWPPRFDRAVGLAEVLKTGPIPPDVLALLTCDALLQTIVLDPDTGAVLDLPTTQRTATTRQRTALAARDHGCLIPACPAQPADCDAHHITYWSAGGKTTLTNLGLLCARHHTETHLGLWTITMINNVPHVDVPDWHHLARPGSRTKTTRNPFHDALTRAHQLAQQLKLDLEPPGSNETTRNEADRREPPDVQAA